MDVGWMERDQGYGQLDWVATSGLKQRPAGVVLVLGLSVVLGL